jgi:hypothetical protein
MDLTEKQFRLGAVSYLTLLNAERQYQQTKISLVQAEAARFADTAALFQALGGGWWNRIPDEQTVREGESTTEALRRGGKEQAEETELSRSCSVSPCLRGDESFIGLMNAEMSTAGGL